MIIEGLLNLLYKFLSFVLGIIPFPATPEDIQANLDSFLEILDYAQTFLPLVFPVNMMPYLIITISLWTIDHLYRPIKWIINKIIEIIP